ncbi:macrophage mannose receptor 1-like [Clarias gariepinus]|uniref:macrophage mannose receptor 1-like n=1 Tax=Clarias gariepinus TaxID=13013 RepID=UPI00234CA8CB|nr:macrophage mannose receptor 1-like [Clarias gariepinus]
MTVIPDCKDNSTLYVALKEAVAFTLDIQQLFHCLLVKPEDRDLLRSFWFEDYNPEKSFIEYRVKVNIFGNIPSPAVAIYGLRHAAREAETELRADVERFIARDFYVDDGLRSLPSAAAAIDLLKRTQAALAHSNLKLHKIAFNSKEVMDAFSLDHQASELRDMDLGKVAVPVQLCGTETYIPHRYHFVNENKTWSEAQTYCRQKYTDLASINNMEEMMKLNNTLKMETVNQAWIGLQRGDTGRWQWSLADQTFYRDGDTYRNWKSAEPINKGGNEFCVEMYVDGTWNDNMCDVSQYFVCYEEKDTNTKSYILLNKQKTWRDAQTYCRENYIDLVSVRNQTKNEKIRKIIQNSSSSGFWIGLFNDSWKCSDQSNSSFRYWSSNKPSGGLNCAAVKVSDQLYWSDVNCTENLPFICHENKLILIKQNLTWKEALRYCRNNHYDLVSVLTQEMQLWVKEVARNASTEHVWLGLRHTCTLGFWYWVTGQTICYQDWARGNGTGFEDCRNEERTGAVQSRGEQQWISLPQSNTLNFICSNYES